MTYLRSHIEEVAEAGVEPRESGSRAQLLNTKQRGILLSRSFGKNILIFFFFFNLTIRHVGS